MEVSYEVQFIGPKGEVIATIPSYDGPPFEKGMRLNLVDIITRDTDATPRDGKPHEHDALTLHVERVDVNFPWYGKDKHVYSRSLVRVFIYGGLKGTWTDTWPSRAL